MDAGQNEPIPMAANEKWLLVTKDIVVLGTQPTKCGDGQDGDL